MKNPSVKNKSSVFSYQSSARQSRKSDDRRLTTDSSLLKIGQAAKALGVSIDTLRRWEKAGKIKATRTPGGTRLYSLESLKKVSPASVETYQSSSLSTEELLKRDSESVFLSAAKDLPRMWDSNELRDSSPAEPVQNDKVKSFFPNFLVTSALILTLTLVFTSWITVSYLTNPKDTKQFFKKNIASGILSPFNFLAEEAVIIIDPKKAKELGFGHPEPPPLTTNYQLLTTNVLAVTAGSQYLEVNSDTQINGSLFVRDSINGLSLEATPSAGTIAFTAGDTQLTITNDALLDQDVSTTSTPGFNTLNLSAAKDQLVFQSGGPSGTLTWTPTAARVITLPDVTTTLVGIDNTQTLTNKSMSGSSNTFTNIPNSALTNSKVTVTAGTNLAGGGDVTLGSSVTLSLTSSPVISGVLKLADGTAAAPSLTFADDTDTGLYRIGTNKIGLITGGSATSGITIDANGNVGVGTITPGATLAVSGNLGIGYTATSATAVPNLGLAVAGNIGIGTTTANYNLSVIGTGNFTGQLTAANGSATTPAYSFTNLTNAGLWTNGNGLLLTTGGSNTSGITVTGAGNVGVGITNPTGLFQVATATSQPLFVNSNGSVGIGTTATDTAGTLQIKHANTHIILEEGDGPVDEKKWVLRGNAGSFDFMTSTDAFDNWQGIMTVDRTGLNVDRVLFPNGNVGIGFTSPNALFTVGATNQFQVNSSGAITTSANNAALSFTGSTPSLTSGGSVFGLFAGGNVGIGTTGNLYGGLTVRGAGTGTNITLQTYGSNLTQGLTVLDNGNIGIGTTGPIGALQVNGAAGIGYSSIPTSSLPTNGLAVSGNVGIGTTSPATALHIVGQTTVTDKILANSGGIDIGTTGTRFGTFYADTVNATSLIGTVVGGQTNSADWTINVDNASADTENMSVTFERGTSTPNAVIGWDTTNKEFDFNSGLNITGTIASTYGLTLTDTTYDITTGTNQHLVLMPNGSGNVGIGTTGPGSSLGIAGNATVGFGGATSIAGPSNGLGISGNLGVGTTSPNNRLQVIGGGVFGADYGQYSAATNGLLVQGNIGIGATTSANKLDVWGNARIAGTLTLDSNFTLSGGQFLANNGSSSLPAYSFTNLTNAGLWTTGNGLLLTTGGSNTSGITVTGAGNVGIGTTAPTYHLDVAGAINIPINTPYRTAGNALLGTVSGDDTYLRSYNDDIFFQDTSGNDLVTIINTGNVGIGTTNPLSLLHVNAGISTTSTVRIGANATGADAQVYFNTNADWVVGIDNSDSNKFKIAGTSTLGTASDRLTIDSNGNVGIGTASPTDKFIVTGGNVGIGVSSPLTALAVNGAGTIGWGLTGVAGPASGLAVSGNVGVGTTSPLGQLHVVGQCVTDDTRLRRRKRRKDGTLTDEYEEIEIKDIQEGDQILSLNEKTGEFEPHAVKALKDMGKQEVFMLVTQYGKRIETTSEHPYLTIEKDIIKQQRFDKTSIFEVDLSPRFEEMGTDTIVAVANKKYQATTRITQKEKVTFKKLFGKEPKLFAPILYALSIVETIKQSRLHPTQLRIDTDYTGYQRTMERIIHHFYPEIIISFVSVGHGSFADKAALGVFRGKKIATGAGSNLKGFPTAEWLHHEWLHGSATHTIAFSKDYHKLTDLSIQNASWKKVKYLKPGNIIATVDGWEKISAKYSTGRKQTFDIEVEGTHNFVGNDIVAHNTYINGNLGIGSYSGLIVPSNGLAVSGNVGIGTTTANYNLSVVGTGNFTGQITAADGTAAAPAYAFSNDTDTGLWRVNNNLAALTVGGTPNSSSTINGLSINSSGNIGIGTTNPAVSLHIRNSAAELRIDDGSGDIGAFQLSSGNLRIGSISTHPLWFMTNNNSWGAISATGGFSWGNNFASSNPGQNNMIIEGNVGIGVSSPGATLQVAGNGVFGFGVSAIAGPSNGLAVSGNVGVGTTSPLGQLHVVGQCVAQGTRIRRRRRGKNGDWIEEDIPVEDIKPDDEVLSLNDKTGAWEWHKVEKTWDKGRQETIKIVTQRGKWIETTNEHPYLTITKDVKPLSEAGKFEVDLSTRMEKNSDTFVAVANSTASAIIRVTAREKQALKKLFGKTPRLFPPTIYALCIVEIIRRGKIRPSQLKICTDYPSHERRMEAIINHFYPGIVVTFGHVGHGTGSYADRAAYQAFSQKKKTGAGSNLQGFPAAEQLHDDWLHRSTAHTVLTPKGYHKFIDLSIHSTGSGLTLNKVEGSIKNASWKKVKYLKPGDVIATSDGWEKIQAKYSTGRKQTYDLQVEGTHNFVGNDIVAHNTAIFQGGNVGIGFTSPDRLLQIGSDINIVGTAASILRANGAQFSITGSTANTTAKKLTLGIDTTDNYGVIQAGNTDGTAYNLSLQPGGGNVGIGNSSPKAKLHITGVGTTTNKAFRITDSAGTDTVAIYDKGYMGLGGVNAANDPNAKLTIGAGDSSFNDYDLGISADGGASNIGFSSAVNGANASADLYFLRSRGTISSKSANSADDQLGRIIFRGYTDNTNTAASIQAHADTGWGSSGTDTPGRLTFWTSPDGSSTLSERMRIDSAGNIGIGIASVTNKFQVTGGNVGIGTTTALSTLAVNGNSTIGWGLTGVAGPASGLAVSGNVGVGTTSPLGQLHVVGQCVTGDTRLRRRRRRKDGSWSDEYEGIEIKDIKEGDQILSLNEKTGEFEPHTVKALKDMGRQEVFMLVTQYGKMIETTNEHPYLTIEKPVKIDQVKSGKFEVDQSIRIETTTADTILSVANEHNAFSIKLDRKQKREIYQKYYQGKQPKLFGPEIFALLIVDAIKQSKYTATDLVIDIEYPTYELRIAGLIRKFYPLINISFKSIGKNSPAHIAGYEIYTQRKLTKSQRKETLANSILKGFLASELLHPEFTGIRSPHGLLNISKYITKWAKVKYLKPGTIIATADGWEKIQAKYSTGRKQTYDLQVEGTHNFVGNDIVAHNTAIFQGGNVGIGFTTPDRLLQIGSDINIVGTAASILGANGAQFSITGSSAGTIHKKLTLGMDTTDNYGVIQAGNTDGTAYNLSLQPGGGNVGIGTTGPSNLLTVGASGVDNSITKLYVTGGIELEGTTFVNTIANRGANDITFAANGERMRITYGGNVGIGTTGPTHKLQVSGASGGTTGLFAVQIAGVSNGFQILTDASNNLTYSMLTGGGAQGFYQNAGGNVGIGTNSPVAQLDVRNTNTGTGLHTYIGSSAGQFGILDNGNVGIGTTNPLTSLYVNGNAMIGYSSGAPASLSNGLAVSGNVGIGTTNPGKLLDIVFNSDASNGIRIQNNSTGTSANTNIILTNDAGNNGQIFFQNSNRTDYAGANSLNLFTKNGAIGFITNNGGSTPVVSMAVTNGGNVGIGTTTANSLLSVAGGAHIGSIRQGISAPTDGLFVDGNVGIGATTSNNKLDVWGNARIAGTGVFDSTLTALNGLIGYSGVTAPTSGLAVSGNLGVGTTSPLGQLHVVGQCVTGDTRLRRRKKKGKKGEEDEWEDVEIKDIKEGDEILTLDETIGMFTVSKIKALKNMGIKEIFELTTSSGKTIRTTGNHPYLLAPELKQNRVGVFIDAANFEISAKSLHLTFDYKDIMKAFFPDRKTVNFRYYTVDFGTKRQRRFLGYLDILGAEFITKEAKIIKKQGQDDEHKANFDVEISVDAAIQKDSFDTFILFSGDSDFVYLASKLQGFGKKVVVVSPWRTTARELRQTADLYLDLYHMPFVSHKKGPLRASQNRFLDGMQILQQIMPFVNGGKWVKVKDLTAGQMIATLGINNKPIFESIVSIKRQKSEQVFDIEVEGTHNFVGNNIVAHNTAIFSGNVGIGVTSPTTFNLQIAGSIGPQANDTYDLGSDAYRFKDLYLGPGTLHIGTSTSDEYTLAYDTTNNRLGFNVNDSGPAEVVFDSSGNVGIGTTGPGGKFDVQDGTAGTELLGRLYHTDNTNSASDVRFQIRTGGESGGDPKMQFEIAGGQKYTMGIDNSDSDKFKIGTNADLGLGNLVTITTNGNVGIGTASPTDKFIVTGGNVGIGVSSPISALAVNGAGTIGWGLTGVAGPASGLAVSGNLGVGTTSPLGQLHVVGQCVGAGTRIRRRRRGKNGEWIEEDIPVEDIMPDDEVLSLNDRTGAWEWHKVEKTMDMGIQTVIGIKTSGGKYIKTTINHPYLVQIKPPKIISGVFELDLSNRIENINKPTFIALANQEAAYIIKLSAKTKHILKPLHQKKHVSKFGFQIYAHLIRQMIKLSGFRVNKLIIDHDYAGNEEEINAIIKQVYPKLPVEFKSIGHGSPADRSAHTAATKGVGINKTITAEEFLAGKAIKKETQFALKGATEATDHQGCLPGFPLHRVSSGDYHNLCKLSMGETRWVKVGQLNPGDKIATVDGWEYVIDIEELNRVQTYDLQIENTHNFLANDIVAHNTAIFQGGNVGIGFTSPDRLLQIGSDINIVGSAASLLGANGAQFSITGSSAGTIARKLTLGIDTTDNYGVVQAGNTDGTAYNLSLQPGGGNVGIGTTSPSALFSVGSTSQFQVNSSGAIAAVTGITTSGGYTQTGSSANTFSGANTFSANNAALSFTGSTPSITSGGSVLGLFAGGNVGIGTTGNLYGGLTVRGAGTGTNITLQTYGSGLGQGLTVLDNGNVGVGTTNPGGKLEVASGNVFFGDTSNANMTQGLTINQGANDNEILTLKSSDVAHGVTTRTETDTFATFMKTGADDGGLLIRAFADTGSIGLVLQGYAPTDSIDKTTAAFGYITLYGRKNSGTGETNPGADANLLTIRGHDTTRFIFDEEGTLHHVPSSDTSLDLLTVQVTGTPTLGWDETNDVFTINKGLTVTSGNVGIGTSATGAALQVNGGGLFGWGTASTALSSGAIAGFNGNVGVGTTSPLGQLHVVGQCVAQGTRIRRRRRGKNGDWIEEDIPVEDIQPDDEILSLNDKTGEWEWHKVEKTWDKGIQTVYELVTQSGKSIQTTSEHPYLTEQGWKKVSQLKKGIKIATYDKSEKPMFAFVDETGIGSGDPNQTEMGIGVLTLHGSSKELFEFNRKLRKVLVSAIDILGKQDQQFEFKFKSVTKRSLPLQKKLLGIMSDHHSLWSFSWKFQSHKEEVWDTYLNSTRSIFEDLQGKFAVLLDFIDKPRRSERTLVELEQLPAVVNALQVESQGTIFLQVADIILGGLSYSRSKKRDIIKKKLSQAVLKILGIKKATADPVCVASYEKNIPQKDHSVNTFDKLSIDGEQSRAIKFEKIVSIKKAGRKQTYDLQIEGTHNFVGNDIVAHNTYINGNLGIGAYSGLTVPTNGLAVSGNVGIGTSTANSLLSVAGGAHIGSLRQGISAPTDGLFVDGNVGIGATTSVNKLDVWGNARIAGTLTVDQTSTFGGNLTLSGNLLPAVDDTYDLGSNTARWRDLYLGPGTLHVGTSTSDEYSLSYDTTNNRLGFNVNDSGPAEIVMDSSGNVGIGTTGPINILDIRGNLSGATLNDKGVYLADTTAAAQNVGASIMFAGQYDTNTNATFAQIHSGKENGTLGNYASYLRFATRADGGAVTEQMRITSAGNVGIGNAGTAAMFAVGSSSQFQVNSSGAIAAVTGITTSGGYTQTGSSANTFSGANTFSANSAALSFTGTTPSITSGSSVFGIFAGGNVGIGTTGNLYGGLTVRGAGTGTNIALQTYGSGLGQGLTVLDNGRVGIGTTNPATTLVVTSNSGALDTLRINVASNIGNKAEIHGNSAGGTIASPTITVTDDELLSLAGYGYDTATASEYKFGAAIDINRDTGAGSQYRIPGYIRFRTSQANDGANIYERVRLTSTGNLGIGTSSPLSLLSVSGNAHIGSIRQGISAPTDGLFVDGNVGIGATTSNNKLDVWGNARIAGTGTFDSTLTALNGLIGYSGVTAPASGLAISGNVGVGTTSPLGQLHVVGQCVTGDTRLRRRRRKGKGESEKGEDDWEEITIKDIQAGDEILSLNEKTGEFEPHTVQGLLDMGIQDIRELITQSKLKIKTTSEHPYLVLKNVSLPKLPQYTIFEADPSIRIDDPGRDTFFAIANKQRDFVVKLTKEEKQILARHYQKIGRSNLFGPEVYARLIAATIKKFDIKVTTLIVDQEYSQNYDKTIAEIIEADLPQITLHFGSVGKHSPAHLAANRERLNLGKKVESQARSNLYGFRAAELLHPETSSAIRSPLSLLTNAKYTTEWVKVKYLKPGMTIATIRGWQKISNIVPRGRQQVFDIEVEGTHNFVGNDIVAHNTLIMNGNLGIGTASPASKFHLVGSGTGTGVQLMTQNSAQTNFGLAVLDNGNVGIGTTNPAAKLFIDEDNDNPAVVIDSESTNQNALLSRGKYAGEFIQDLGGGFGLKVQRNINEAGSYPLVELVDDHTANTQPTFKLTQDGTGDLFQAFDGTTQVFTLKDGGNVGIGFTTPDRKLQLASDINITGSAASLLGANGAQFSITGSTANTIAKKLTLGIDTTDNYGVVQAGNTDGTAYNLSLQPGGGNVGIGTTTANSLLSVAGGAHIGSLYQSISAPANGLFVDGNVGIGATTSSNKLDVWGNARVTGTLSLDGNFTTNGTITPSGQFLATDGSASLPGYSFTSDPNTGMYRVGSDNLALTAGGVRALDIKFDGGASFSTLGVNVAADITSFLKFGPGGRNGTWSTINATDTIALHDNAGNTTSAVEAGRFTMKLTTAGADPLTLASSLFVGIPTRTSGSDTVTNTAALYVEGAGTFGTNNYAIYSGSGTNYFGGNVGIGTISPVAQLDVRNTNTGTGLHTYIGSSGGQFAILDNGNVGIGTTNPGTNLVVRKGGTTTPDANSAISIINSGIAFMSLYDSTTQVGIIANGVGGDYVGTISNHRFGIAANNTQYLTVDTNGNIGIGTLATSPIAQLDVRNTNTGTGLHTYIGSSGGQFGILDNGNVGIGTTGPSSLLDIGVADSSFSTGQFHLGRDAAASAYITSASSGTDGSTLAFEHYRGTHASKSALSAGDTIGWIAFNGYTNARYGAAAIEAAADTGWGTSGTDAPGRLVFYTTPDGSSTLSERMRIDSAGRVLVNGTSSYGRGLKQLLEVNSYTAQGGIVLTSWNNTTAERSPILDFQTSKGETAGTYTAMGAADEVGRIGFRAANGTNFTDAAGITAATDGTISGSATPGVLKFWTTPASSTTLSERMRIDSSGNVGIGTVSPIAQLDVRNTNTGTGLHTYIGSSAGQFGILDNGNVGIGTTSPVDKLEVVLSANNKIKFSEASTAYSQSFSDFSTAGAVIALSRPLNGDYLHSIAAYDATDGKNNLGISSRHSTVFQDTGGSESMRLTNAGNIGMGTTAPDRKLQIAGTMDLTASIGSLLGTGGTQFNISGATTSSGKKLVLGMDTTDNYGVIQAGNIDGTAYNLSLQPGGGNVGIGTAGPLSKLDVAGNITVRNGSDLRLYAGDDTNWRMGFSTSGTGNFTRTNVTSNSVFVAVAGNTNEGFTVGKNGGASLLEILGSNGQAYFSGNVGVGNSAPPTMMTIGKVGGTGDLTVYGTGTTCTIGNGTGATNCSSDIRLKTDIQTLSSSTLDDVMKLNPVNFKWIDPSKPQTNNLGFIAQEVQEIFPEVAHMNADGYWGLDYAALTVPAIKAIQEQQNQLSAISLQLSDLQNALSISEDGTLNVPKLNAGTITLDPSIATASAQLTINNGQLAINSDPNYVPLGPDLATNNNYVDLGGKIASLEERVKSQESRIKELEDKIVLAEATASASTTSEEPKLTSEVSQATDSAQISSSSASLTADDSVLTTDKLTPPDILYATGSAQLTNLTVHSEATVSGQLTAYDLNVQNGLKALGKTTLGSTIIAGDLVVDGTMTITGNSISTLGDLSNLSDLGILYLQNGPLAQGLDILNGVFTFTKDGTLTVSGTVLASQFSVKQGTTAGVGKVTAGQIDAIIENEYVDENSVILITPHTSLNQTIAVADKVKGGFLVKLAHTESADIKFDYLIVGVK